jgi:hypothetical protein
VTSRDASDALIVQTTAGMSGRRVVLVCPSSAVPEAWHRQVIALQLKPLLALSRTNDMIVVCELVKGHRYPDNMMYNTVAVDHKPEQSLAPG